MFAATSAWLDICAAANRKASGCLGTRGARAHDRSLPRLRREVGCNGNHDRRPGPTKRSALTHNALCCVACLTDRGQGPPDPHLPRALPLANPTIRAGVGGLPTRRPLGVPRAANHPTATGAPSSPRRCARADHREHADVLYARVTGRAVHAGGSGVALCAVVRGVFARVPFARTGSNHGREPSSAIAFPKPA